MAASTIVRPEAQPQPTPDKPGMFDDLVTSMTDAEARREAERCLECGGPDMLAPCVRACPAGVDVPGFIACVARGKPERAGEIIFAENLLGATCARVCPVEELCEGACVMERAGRRPVEIARLQRFAADRAVARGRVGRAALPHNGVRVAVIGAGPAGLACAGELAARGFHVTVHEAREEIGGLVRYAIAPYRVMRDPLPAEARVLMRLGVRIQLNDPVDSAARLAEITAESDAVFLGVGLGADTRVEMPGDTLPGVWESLTFIEAIKVGAPPHVGDRVLVFGGGNTAIDIAREAVRLGAREVTMVYRRTEREMPAYPHELRDAKREGVRFEWLAAPVRFIGHTKLTGVECVRMQLGEPDASGRARVTPLPGSEFTIPACTAVTALGQETCTAWLGRVPGLTTSKGHIVIDPETGQTANPKFFAGGDAVTGGATVVAAVRAGKVAARGIERWVSGARR